MSFAKVRKVCAEAGSKIQPYQDCLCEESEKVHLLFTNTAFDIHSLSLIFVMVVMFIA